MSVFRPNAVSLRKVWLAGCAGLIAVLAGSGPGAAAGGTLEAIRKRGHLVCGVSEGTIGFSQANDKGIWSGLDADFCSAVAAGVLGNKDLVKFRPLTVADRFRALQAGEVDVLARSTTWTLSRDTEFGIRFAGVLFYDGQGFLVRRSQALTSVLELSGATICSLAGSSGEQTVADYFTLRHMRYLMVTATRWDDLVKAYAGDRCTLLSSDISSLALEREHLANPADHMLLPELISKEPMGPAVKQGDEQWFSIVRWTLMALIQAEELGLTSANVDEQRSLPQADIRRFMGTDSNPGQGLGLANDWTYQVVKQVGNYGELFERNLGVKSPLKLERGINDLWTRGGLMYAAPFR